MAKNHIEKIAPSFIVNFGKSVTYSMDKALKTNIMPNTVNLAQKNSEVLRATTDGIKNINALGKKIDSFFKSSEMSKDLKDITKNTLSDLRSGKWYNRDREMANEKDIMGMDNDWSVDFSPNVTNIVSDNRATAKAVYSTSQQLAKTMSVTTKATMEFNAKAHKGSMMAMNVINENIGMVAKFNGDVMKPFLDNANKFFTDSMKVQNEIKEILFKGFEVQSKYYSNMMTIEEDKPAKDDDIENVLFGGLDLKEYQNVIKKNVKGKMDDMGMSMMQGSGMNLKEAFKANPISTLLEATSLNTSFIPKQIVESLSNFDNTIKGFLSSGVLKINDIAKNGMNFKKKNGFTDFLSGISSSVADFFKVKIKSKNGIDTSTYMKKAVAFDGITRKSIIEVIPMYLRKILSAISGQDEIIYNYDSGQATTKKAMLDDLKNKRNTVSYDYSEFRNNTLKNMNLKGKDSDYKKTLTGDLNNFLQNFEGELLPLANKNYKKFEETIRNKGLDFKTENAEKLIFDAINKLSEKDKLNFSYESIDARQRRNKDWKNLEGNQELYGYSQVLMDSGLKDTNSIFSADTKVKNQLLTEVVQLLKTGVAVIIKGDDRNQPRRGGRNRRSPNSPNSGGGNNTSSSEPEPPQSATGDIARTFIERPDDIIKNASTKSREKSSLWKRINEGVSDFFKKPSEWFSNTINQATHQMYKIIFGGEADDAKRKNQSFFGKLSDTVKGFFGKMDERLFGKKDDDGNRLDKGIVGVLKDKLFGTKDGDGNIITKGIMSNVTNIFSDSFKSMRHQIFGLAYTDSKGVSFDGKDDSIVGIAKRQVSVVMDKVSTAMFGTKNTDGTRNMQEGFLNTMYQSVVTPFKVFKDEFFGKDKNSKTGSSFKLDSKLYGEIKQASPELAKGAITGGVAGLFLPGGPIVGSLLGTGVQLVRHTKTFNSMLFGEKDDHGNITKKGLIPKDMQVWFSKNKGAMKNGAIAGGLTGLLFGSPVLGSLMGTAISATGMASKLKESLFGKTDGNGNKLSSGLFDKITPDQKTMMKKMGGSAAAGGVLGMFLPGGPLVGALTLTATNMLLTSDKFKNSLFGEKDDNGKRKGGLVGTIKDFFSVSLVKPMSSFFKETTTKVNFWFQTAIMNPVKDALAPFKKEAQLMFQGFKNRGKQFFKAIDNSFAKHIGIPLTEAIQTRLIDPVSNAFKKIFGGIGKMIGGVLSAPFKMIKNKSEKLMKKHVQLGEADYIGDLLTNRATRNKAQKDAYNSRMSEIEMERKENGFYKSKFFSKQRLAKEKKRQEYLDRMKAERDAKGSIFSRAKNYLSDVGKNVTTKGRTSLAFSFNDLENENGIQRIVNANNKNAKTWGKFNLPIIEQNATVNSPFSLFNGKVLSKFANKPVSITSEDVTNLSNSPFSLFNGKALNGFTTKPSSTVSTTNLSNSPFSLFNGKALNGFTTKPQETPQTNYGSTDKYSVTKQVNNDLQNNSTVSPSNTKVEVRAIKQTPVDMGGVLKDMSNNIKDIRDEVKGQLNGVGWNIDKIVDILQKHTGIKGEALNEGERRSNNKRKGLFGKLFDKVKSPFSKAKGWIGGKKDAVMDIIKSPFKLVANIGTAIKGGIKGIGKGIKGAIGLVKDSFLGIFKVVGMAAKGFGHALIGAGKLTAKVASGFGSLAKNVLEGLGAGLKPLITGIGETIGGFAHLFGSTIAGVGAGLGNLAKNAIPALGSAIGSATSIIFQGISAVIGTAWKGVKTVGSIIASPFKKKIGMNATVTTNAYIIGGKLDTVMEIDKSSLLFTKLDSIIQSLTSGLSTPTKVFSGSTEGQKLEAEKNAEGQQRKSTQEALLSIAESSKNTSTTLTGVTSKKGIFGKLLLVFTAVKSIFGKVFKLGKKFFKSLVTDGFLSTFKKVGSVLGKVTGSGMGKIIGKFGNSKVGKMLGNSKVGKLLGKTKFGKYLNKVGGASAIENVVGGLTGGAMGSNGCGCCCCNGVMSQQDSNSLDRRQTAEERQNLTSRPNELSNGRNLTSGERALGIGKKIGKGVALVGASALANDFGQSMGNDVMEQMGLKGTLVGDVGSSAIGLGSQVVATKATSKGLSLVSNIIPQASKEGLASKLTIMIEKVMTSKPVQKIIGSEGIKKILEKAMPKILKGALEKGATKLAAWVATGGTLAVVTFCADLVSGMSNARRVFALPKDFAPTVGMRIAAGMSRALSGLTLGIVDEGWIAELVYNALGDEDNKKKLKNAQAQFEKQASDAGYSTDDFNREVNKSFGESLWDGTKSVVKSAWNGVKSIGSKTVEGVKKGVSWVGGKIKDGWNSLFGNGRGDESSKRYNTNNNSSVNGMTYFNQKDPRWADSPFQAPNDSLNDTIGTAGCGPTAVSMALSKYGVNIDPKQASQFAMQGGYKISGQGTDSSFISDFANANGIGLTPKMVSNSSNIMDIDSQLSTGQPVITLGQDGGGKTPYTSSGHYLVIAGKDSKGNYIVNDPLNPSNNRKTFKPEDLMNKTQAYWSTNSGSPMSTNLMGYGGKVEDVINAAKSRLGAPYVWGGVGDEPISAEYVARMKKNHPEGAANYDKFLPPYYGKNILGYDCSGLTQYAYNKIGMNIGRTTYDQIDDNDAKKVSKSELAPSDLIFFGSNNHHVGMYLGGDKMIHAPKSGRLVSIDPVSNGGSVLGYRRYLPEATSMIGQDLSAGGATGNPTADGSTTSTSEGNSSSGNSMGDLFSDIMGIFGNAFNAVAFRDVNALKPIGEGTTESPTGSVSVGGTMPVSDKKGLATQLDDTTTNVSLLNEDLKGVLANKGQTYVTSGKNYGVNPMLGAAIASFETGWGSSNAVKKYNNPAGVMDWNNNYKTLKKFATIEDGIDFSLKNLRKEFIDKGDTSIEAIAKRYAPVGASNDPNGTNGQWPGSVNTIYNQFLKPNGRGISPLSGRGSDAITKLKKISAKFSGRGVDTSNVTKSDLYNLEVNNNVSPSNKNTDNLLQAILKVVVDIAGTNTVIASNTNEIKNKELPTNKEKNIDNKNNKSEGKENKNIFLGNNERKIEPSNLDRKVMQYAIG